MMSTDGKIVVQSGDWLSKYSWVLHGNYTTLDQFEEWVPESDTSRPIPNKDLIEVGDIIVWLPAFNKHKDRPGRPAGPEGPPVDLNSPGWSYIPVPFEFRYEAEVPERRPKDFGYVYLQGQFAVGGRVSGEGGDPSKVTVSQQSVKAALGHKLTEKLDATAGMKFGEDFLDVLMPAIKGRSVENFRQLIRRNFEVAAQYSFQWGKLTVAPQVTVRPLSPQTPVGFAVVFEIRDELLYLDGHKFRAALLGEGGVNFGLTKTGWAYLVRKAGQTAVVQFLRAMGGGVLGWLTSAGVIVAATIIGTVAIVSLVAWAYDQALRPNEVEVAITWYVNGYLGLVFQRSGRRPTPADVAFAEKARLLGEQDAVLDARAWLRQAGDPAADGTAREVTAKFGYQIREEYQATYDCGKETAEWHFEQELKAKARQKVAGR
jgi:hypothetical protein